MTRVDLVLSDDWELRGDGSGDMRVIQFGTLWKLLEVYEHFNLRGSFFVEVLQQIRHREFSAQAPFLGELADAWDTAVCDLFKRGHDVQLHIHPQWSNAEWIDGVWRLRGDWSILRYSRRDAETLLRQARDYLEALLGTVDQDYRCLAFRSGAWCLAPSEFMVPTLRTLGIRLDASIVQGVRYNERVELDYRELDEAFLPFFPRDDDARRLGSEPAGPVCLPVHSFTVPAWRRWQRSLSRLLGVERSWHGNCLAPSQVPIPGAAMNRYGGWGFTSTLNGSLFRVTSRLRRVLSGRLVVSDLSNLSRQDIDDMLVDIRRRARRSCADAVPVVLANHTKDLGHLDSIRYLAERISSSNDFEVVTVSEVLTRIEAGVYPVRRAGDGYENKSIGA